MLWRRQARSAAQVGGHDHGMIRRAVVRSRVNVTAIEEDGHLRENAGGGDAIGERLFAETAAIGQIAVEAIAPAAKRSLIEANGGAVAGEFSGPGVIDIAVAAIGSIAGKVGRARAEDDVVAHARAIEDTRPVAMPGDV